MTIQDNPLTGAEPIPAPKLRSVSERDLAALFRHATAAHALLTAGEVARYMEMLAPTPDFSIMDPLGGPASHGYDGSPETMENRRRFFRGGGSASTELVASYGSGELAVLAFVERARMAIGDLPEQDWALRVTLAFRREAGRWRLVHRHADPLAHGIDLAQSAALGRGEAALAA